jgi:hypothetical protein
MCICPSMLFRCDARPIDKLNRSAQIQLGRMSLAAQYLIARFDNFRVFLWRAKMTVSGILLHVLNAVYPHSSVGDPFGNIPVQIPGSCAQVLCREFSIFRGVRIVTSYRYWARKFETRPFRVFRYGTLPNAIGPVHARSDRTSVN